MPGSTRRRALFAAIAPVAVLLAVPSVPAGATAGVGPDGLSAPSAVATSGGTLFVANRTSGTITMLNSASGALQSVVARKSVGVGAPLAVAAASGVTKGKAWRTVLAAAAGGTYRLLNVVTRSGRLTAVPLGAAHKMACAPKDFVYAGVDAAHDYVVVCTNGATWTVAGHTGLSGRSFPSRAAGTPVTSIDVVGMTLYETVGTTGAAQGSATWNKEGLLEVSLSSGKLVDSLSNAHCASCGFGDPDGVAVSGATVWVSDGDNDQATQLSKGPLAFVGTQTSNLYGTGAAVASPSAVYFASVDGPVSSMVTMFTTSPVAYQWMMCNTNDAYRFDNPSGLALGGAKGTAELWVANPIGGTAGHGLLDEMDATSGALVRTIG